MTTTAVPKRSSGQSTWSIAMRRFRRHKLAMASLVVIVLLVLMALFAPWIAPQNPFQFDPNNLRPYEPPSASHWFGTDDLGRDVFSRIIYGSRISLAVGFSVAFLGIFIGTLMGVLAGFFGGWVDVIISRFIEFMQSIPTFPLLLVIASILAVSDAEPIVAFRNTYRESASVFIVIVVLALLGWMGTARLVRGEILKLKNLEYVDAARALGAKNSRIMFRHLVPNTVAIIIVQTTLDVGAAILVEAGLSFLGFGIQPPVSSWGNMLSGAQEAVFSSPWLTFYPGLMILLTCLAFNFLGDGLRDALDPRSRL
ncbi:oligopeptide ABC transporter permease [Deinococcus peraridilitoris]|uniref:ABC-type dipeptide/oligopeptide/nickel transport system, permease component n=1 Tax=Deinococcus peraridilitoris (strain DSM 19664 / LMG 22246 / CIP 109416 / KR-200) TaxID=937777 RepID=L0A0J7_DEIPD|nr:oligopeptide ABC transporter permease [Deinococcus peraridilitoris]AFZ66682.1 ABC-type dipeptide/oligopeptide/nickel transport system, permease component [Deinococcus peraridilitoris DSM 19664]